MRESRLHLLSVLSMAIILTVLGSGAQDAHAQEPVLERYVLQVGSGNESPLVPPSASRRARAAP